MIAVRLGSGSDRNGRSAVLSSARMAMIRRSEIRKGRDGIGKGRNVRDGKPRRTMVETKRKVVIRSIRREIRSMNGNGEKEGKEESSVSWSR